MEYCQACRRQALTRYVEFYQNIGMLVMRSMRGVKGHLCKRCVKKYFWELTGLTLLTGWWGVISAIINPFLIINNVLRYIGCMGMPDVADQALPVEPGGPGGQTGVPGASPAVGQVSAQPAQAHPLASFRQDIAMRLRGGQSSKEIAQYIAPLAGVTLPSALQYVEDIKQSGSE